MNERNRRARALHRPSRQPPAPAPAQSHGRACRPTRPVRCELPQSRAVKAARPVPASTEIHVVAVHARIGRRQRRVAASLAAGSLSAPTPARDALPHAQRTAPSQRVGGRTSVRGMHVAAIHAQSRSSVHLRCRSQTPARHPARSRTTGVAPARCPTSGESSPHAQVRRPLHRYRPGLTGSGNAVRSPSQATMASESPDPVVRQQHGIGAVANPRLRDPCW